MTTPSMCKQDWDIVALWQEHGIPVDGTTVETSLEIIGKLAAEIERRDVLIEELMHALPPNDATGQRG